MFDAWLERLGGAEETPFEDLVRAHPGLETAFASLHREWREIETGIESALPEDLPEAEQDDLSGDDILVREPGAVLGDYRLERLLGEGAVGQVWEAQQLSLDRPVALKLLRPTRASVARGLQLVHEARAAGRLDHPGIVSVYAAGTIGGVAYLAQQLVKDGRTLGDIIEEARRDVPTGLAPYRRTAELIAEVADAVHAAHAAGILHRDIKPGNILVGADGRPRVSDFGLAHVVGEDSEQPGLVGTCAYMSPEQAVGRGNLDERSDVFGLGAVLFESLTLRRAFEGDSVPAVLRAVRTEDPPDPRSLRARIPAELALICLKALEKDRSDRYADMEAFAADLRRYLTDEPILAAPPSRWTRGRKWLRRHPAWAASLALGIAALATVTLFLVREVELRRETAVQKNRADERAEAAEWQGYVANLRAVSLALDRGVSEEARRRLEACAPGLRGWEWFHDAQRVDSTAHKLVGHQGAITSVALSGDGEWIVTASGDGTLRLWSGRTGEAISVLEGLAHTLHSVAVAESSRSVVAGSDNGSVIVWRPLALDEDPAGPLQTLEFHQSAVRSVAVSDDGLIIAAASDDGSAHVWDRRQDREFTVTPRILTGMRGVALSRDGRRLLTASRLGTVSVWDVPTAELVQLLPWDARNEVAIALDALGGRRFLGTADGSIRVWNSGDEEAERVIPGDGHGVRALASTADGNTLLAATAGGVRVYTVDRVSLPGVLTGNSGLPTSIGFSDDGQIAVAGCDDGTAVVWDRRNRGVAWALTENLEHAQSVLALDTTGQRVASAGLGDRIVRIWDGTTGALIHELRGHDSAITSLAMSGDGRVVASGGMAAMGSSIRLWDATTGKALAVLRGHRLSVSGVALDETGETLVSGSYDGTVRTWVGGEQVDRLDAPGRSAVSSVRLSADGRRLAASCTDGTVFVRDAGQEPVVLRPSQGLAGGTLDMSADGRYLAWASSQEDLMIVWDLVAGSETHWPGEARFGHAVFALSPDGSRMVSASRGEGALRMRSRTAPETLTRFSHPSGTLRAAAFSGDGHTLITAGSDGSLRVWVGPPRDYRQASGAPGSGQPTGGIGGSR